MRSPRSRSGRGLRYVLLALALVTAGSCTGSGTGENTGIPSPPPGAADPLKEIARDKGSVLVIVDLAVARKADGTWDRAKIAAAQRKLLADLGGTATVTARYETTPQLALELEARGLDRLRASPLVLGVHLNETDEATE